MGVPTADLDRRRLSGAELEVLVALNLVKGIGAVLYGRLLKHFGGLEELGRASVGQLQEVTGIGAVLAGSLRTILTKGDHQKELDLARLRKVRVVTIYDDDYPANLRSVFDYPLLLYVRGELRREDDLAVAVVGSRHGTQYGQAQAERIAYGLAQRGVCVVSGLARGVDTAAHSGALQASGRTTAVLGSGILNIYPSENVRLADKIAGSGAIVSEIPLAAPPDARNFPRRNRIIAGLSLGTVVVEAGRRSGALITAEWALEMNREVFAVPGKVDSPASQGCHGLLKQGAKLVEEIEDILEELGPYQARLKADTRKPPTGPERPKDEREALILDILTDEPQNIDEVIALSNLPPATVASLLLLMEMRKQVKSLPGKRFVKVGDPGARIP